MCFPLHSLRFKRSLSFLTMKPVILVATGSLSLFRSDSETSVAIFLFKRLLILPLCYTNIKRYIYPREFGSFNVNLSRVNKCSE